MARALPLPLLPASHACLAGRSRLHIHSTRLAAWRRHGAVQLPTPASPAAAARQVAFDYVGYNESGAVIDSSYRLGRPASTRLGIKGLIPGALLLWRCCCGWLGAQAGAPTTPAWVCGCRV